MRLLLNQLLAIKTTEENKWLTIDSKEAPHSSQYDWNDKALIEPLRG